MTTTADGGQPIPMYSYAPDDDFPLRQAEIDLAAFGSTGSGPAGVTASGTIPTITDYLAQNYRGPGLIAGNEARILYSHAANCWVGAKLSSSDAYIFGSVLKGHRDVGLWIAVDAGNCYSVATHCYGARIACYNAGGAWFKATSDIYADALIGQYSNAEQILTNCFFQHNTVADAVFYGGNCQMLGCTVMAQLSTVEQHVFPLTSLPLLKPLTGKIGVYMGGDKGKMIDGRLELTDWVHDAYTVDNVPATGFVVAGNRCKICTTLGDSDGLEGTTGILVSGTRKGLKVDCDIEGFEDSDSVVLKFEEGASVLGLDVALRVNSAGRDLKDFVPLAENDWSGRVHIIDVESAQRELLVRRDPGQRAFSLSPF